MQETTPPKIPDLHTFRADRDARIVDAVAAKMASMGLMQSGTIEPRGVTPMPTDDDVQKLKARILELETDRKIASSIQSVTDSVKDLNQDVDKRMTAMETAVGKSVTAMETAVNKSVAAMEAAVSSRLSVNETKITERLGITAGIVAVVTLLAGWWVTSSIGQMREIARYEAQNTVLREMKAPQQQSPAPVKPR